MRTVVSLAVAGAVIAATAGTAAAQYSEQTRRQNQQYSESLRKGQVTELREERVVQTASVVRIEDQFPEQGADNPSGLLSNGDFNSENNTGAETIVRPGHPFTRGMDPTADQLDPQEAPPHYRRGPVIIRQ